jgi:hypothetical protein
MSNRLLLKSSGTADAVPDFDDLELAELVINTRNGKMFCKTYDGATYAIVDLTLSSPDEIIASGPGLIGRSASGAGPAALLSGADAVALLPASTPSADGKATAAQVSRLNKSPVITCYYTPSPTMIPLTTTPENIVSVTHTPTLSTGSVIFDFKFYVASAVAAPFIAHFHSYFDNSLIHKFSETGRVNPGEGMTGCRVIVSNYTGGKICRVQASEYSSASYPTKVHETYYMDGGVLSLPVPWSCVVTEIP